MHVMRGGSKMLVSDDCLAIYSRMQAQGLQLKLMSLIRIKSLECCCIRLSIMACFVRQEL